MQNINVPQSTPVSPFAKGEKIFWIIWAIVTLIPPIFWFLAASAGGFMGLLVLATWPLQTLIQIVIQVVALILVLIFRFKGKGLIFLSGIILILSLTGFGIAYNKTAQRNARSQVETKQCLAKQESITSPNFKKNSDYTEYNDGEISFKLPKDFVLGEETIRYQKSQINPNNKPNFRGNFQRKIVKFYNDKYQFTMYWIADYDKTRPWRASYINPGQIGDIFYEKSNNLMLGNLYISLTPGNMDDQNYLSVSWSGHCILIDKVFNREEFGLIIDQFIKSIKLNQKSEA